MGILEMIEAIQTGKVSAALDTWPDYAGKPYRPGSGTEGVAFDEAWCEHCSRDAAFRDGGCEDPELGCKILADTFAFDIDDPNYPKEWVHDKNGRPCCTAYTEDPKQPVRCNKTIDMFTGRQG